MYLLIFLIIAVNLLKLSLANYFPLIGDEAYYWLWSKHLDFSYVDHPPLIAYVNFFITTVAGNSEFAVRCAAIFIVLLISLLIYLSGKELFDRQTALAAVVMFNLLPAFFGGGLFLVPQTLLFLFWVLSLYLLIKIIKTKNELYWYFLGASTGLGLLSDYTMILFLAGVGAYLLFNRECNFWLRRKEPYLALLIAFILFSPVIGWNISHYFPSFAYHGERAKSFNFTNIFYFILLQMLLYTPPVFISTLKTTRVVLFKRGTDLLSLLSAAIFVPFSLLSPFLMVGGHWTAPAYLSAFFQRKQIKSIIAFSLLVNILVIIYYLFLYPTPKEPNRQLAEYINRIKPDFVVSDNLGLAALVSFHGKTRVYMPAGRHAQYDLWGKPALKRGSNVLYFNLEQDQLASKLQPIFNRVSEDPQKRIFTKDADIPNRTKIFFCEGFKGELLP